MSQKHKVNRSTWAQTSFAFDFLKEVTNGGPNAVCCSPFSVSVCLAMLYAGAKGETRKEIEKLIAGDNKVQEADIHLYFCALLDKILKREPNDASRDYMFVLETANKLYVREGLTLKESYQKIIGREYAGMMEQVDFADSERVCKKINAWVTKSTNGMIKEIMKVDELKPEIAMVILNAVYFNSKWEHEFSKKATKEGDFRVNSKRTKKVEFLNMKAKFRYDEDESVQVVRLPYKSERIANYVFLPKEVQEIGSLFDGFDSQTIGDLMQKVRDQRERLNVTLKLPKFEVETLIDLNEVLKKLGMTRSFDRRADFSGITDDEALRIGQAVQKTVIKVNEKGTEAASVTRFGPMTGSICHSKPRNVEFIADHPFFYFIVDERSRCILFAGSFT